MMIQRPGQDRRGGPMAQHGPMAMMKGEKARDFKGTMIKLIQYLGKYKLAVSVVMIFAIASTVSMTSLRTGLFWKKITSLALPSNASSVTFNPSYTNKRR